MNLTHLPLKLRGKIYRSPMPYGGFDSAETTFQEYKEKEINVVVMLTSSEESLQRAGVDLRTFYSEQGIEVIYLPILNFWIPDMEELSSAVEQAYKCAVSGDNIAIHCYAGYGRTGMFAACLARRALGFSGDEAIKWIRGIEPHCIETDEQEDMVRQYQPSINSTLIDIRGGED